MGLYVDIEKKLEGMILKCEFSVEKEHGITGILGASGCGKSMTFKCIAGVCTPDKGRIVLDGRILFDSGRKMDCRVQQRRVGYLFQNYALFPKMNVRENIEIAVKGNRREKRQTAGKYLDMLELGELAGQFPAKLSGGQQQRTALARVLASKPEVLMLDEPFSALDAFLKDKMQCALLDVLQDFDGLILMATHSRDEIYRFCSRIHILDRGRLSVSGDTKDVFRDPVTVAAAKLTGCKNIAHAKRLDAHSIEVPEWNTVLRFRKEVPGQLDSVGIRAHYLLTGEQGDAGNCIVCRCKRVIEDPFEVTLVLENGVWWKMTKEVWLFQYKQIPPEKLSIPEDSVLFLTDRE